MKSLARSLFVVSLVAWWLAQPLVPGLPGPGTADAKRKHPQPVHAADAVLPATPAARPTAGS